MRRLVFVLATAGALGALFFGCALVAGVDDVFLVPKDGSLGVEAASEVAVDTHEPLPDFDTAFFGDSTIILLDAGEDDTRVTVVDMGGEAKPKGCPTGPGPVMARIDVAGGKPPYCIDTTEVTNAQLNVFLADTTEPYDTHAACGPYKITARPKPKNLPGEAAKPANGINYCYAQAYCRWAGKRLCGKIGGGHASYDGDDSTNEWFHACSNALFVSTYPYGPVYDEKTCNTHEFDSGSLASNLVEVKSMPACHGTSGGHALVFDMSGNVAEFDDYASDHTAGSGGSTEVIVRGGSVAAGGALGARCQSSDSWGIDTTFQHAGFRCCADFVP